MERITGVLFATNGEETNTKPAFTSLRSGANQMLVMAAVMVRRRRGVLKRRGASLHQA